MLFRSLDLAVELELIEKSGSWFSCDKERIGQGRDNARLYLKNNPDLTARLEIQIRENMKDVQLFSLGADEVLSADADAEIEAPSNESEVVDKKTSKSKSTK